jgi:hypothetical protein
MNPDCNRKNHFASWICCSFFPISGRPSTVSTFFVVGTGHGFLGALFGVADLLLQVVFLAFFDPSSCRRLFRFLCAKICQAPGQVRAQARVRGFSGERAGFKNAVVFF